MLGGLAVLAFLAARNGSGVGVAGSIIAAIGCAFLFILAFIVLAVLLSLLRQFFIRKAALENAGIGESFRSGWDMFKRNWKSAGLMWLIMLGIGIGFGIVGFDRLLPAHPGVYRAGHSGSHRGTHPRPGRFRDHQHFRQRTAGLDPGRSGWPCRSSS